MTIDLIIGAGRSDPKTTALESSLRRHKSLISTIDTAALYPFSNPGASEKAVGEAGFADEGFVVNTKAMFVPQGGCYDSEGVESSVARSLESLRVDDVNVLYAHAPDRKTPVAEQAAAFDNVYKQGKFKQLGVANLDAEMLSKMACSEEKGYVKPTVYQGQYNILCRAHEASVLPVVRENGMKFMAYSPLAGGFLSGLPTFAPASDLVGTLFEKTDNDAQHGPFYRYWYDRESMHAAVKILKAAADEHGVEMAEVAVRWLVNHSALRDGDGIIIGPETDGELERSVKAYHAGPLPGELVEVIDELRGGVEEDARVIVQF